MYNYFDGFTYVHEEYFGGKAKSDAISFGMLEAGPGIPLKFFVSPPKAGSPEPPAHPINQYFSQQLLALRAYNTIYRVDHDTVQSATPSKLTTESSEDLSEDEQSADDWFSQNLRRARVPVGKKPPREALTDDQRKHLQAQCKIVEDHALMLDEYCDIWYLPGWPRVSKSEKTADQMSKDFNPDKDKKKPKPSKSGIGSKTEESAPESSLKSRAGPSSISASLAALRALRSASQTVGGSSQGTSGGAKSHKKRGSLHDGEPFEAPPSAKRPASGA
ncbi:hypothetical protein C8Q78DRAFT_193047 [Trametes maxima]|nr:hypothetical protein C8Q78DRAFT_193047 [Trametes maxima]